MKRTGAWLMVHALENIGVKFTFGIPGVHNTELYDELNKSEHISPILVTHELGAAYMADGISRTSNSIGTLVIVPAAGTTHAMSGIGEAFLDGIPMLVITGGIRRRNAKSFQLHEIDQLELVRPLTKASFLIRKHSDIIPTVYEAYRIAMSGEPGPVFIEIPVEIQISSGEIEYKEKFTGLPKTTLPSESSIYQAIELLLNAKRPGIFLGWGARRADLSVKRISELLNSPVATTLQGKGVFPADHPLHTGMGFGSYSVPASENAFRDCDCLLAVGVRFGEIATGSYEMKVPENLIHVDINPNVFNRNYPAKITLEGDALEILKLLENVLESRKNEIWKNGNNLPDSILEDKKAYSEDWKNTELTYVNPWKVFDSLRGLLPKDAILVADDGNHTFLATELFPVYDQGIFISPTDFNSMGYCVPAAIGAKLANPNKVVTAVVGDGAFLMTGMEMLTATTNRLGIVFLLFHDGELSQISQAQSSPYNRKTCTVLPEIRIEGIALATGAAYYPLETDEEISEVLQNAFQVASKGRPVVVDIKIDYSRKTRFTQGIARTSLARFPLGLKFRFIGRSILRKITG